MAKIPKSKVIIRRRYLVDCDVCAEAVEPESGAFDSRLMAERAQRRHLDLHESGEFHGPEDEGPDDH